MAGNLDKQRPWDTPAMLLSLVLLSAVPLLWPDIPPLVDLPGHMGRFRVELDLPSSLSLQRFYTFDWALIANLGLDLLVVPLTPLLGLEGAVKLVVSAIPPLTAAGFLWSAREVHGRVPPTALFALPLAYGHPFHFGFVNFALSAALAFVALGLWLHLAKRGRWTLRAALFVPIGLLLWICHVAGFATFLLLAGATELAVQRRRGASWFGTLWRAALHGLALAPPLVLMLLWRSDASGATFGWFDWGRKADWAIMILRDRWEVWDLVSAGLLAATVVIVAPFQLMTKRRRTGFELGLGLAAILLVLSCVILPHTVFGSAYADMRLTPLALATALLAIRHDAWGRAGNAVALAGLAFFLARTVTTTASFALHDRAWRAELAALGRVPRGARLVTFVPEPCPPSWSKPRFDHIASIALVRRGAFANDQWTMPGAQLLALRYPQGEPFVRDPSQFVASGGCRAQGRWTVDQVLARVPRAAFDYIWLVDPPRYDPRSARGLTPVWGNGASVLYRVAR